MVFVLDRKFSNSATRLFADLCKIMQEKGAQTLGISGPVSTSCVSLFFLVTGCRSLNQFQEFHPFSPPIFGVIFVSLRAGPHRSKHVEHLACVCFVSGGGVSCDRKKGG